jgi:murein DD-endopeptidase MepM/ murein hydrolase activator NlpD
MPVLAGCGIADRMLPTHQTPMARPSPLPPITKGVALPASVAIEDTQGGLLQLQVAGVVLGGGVTAAGFGSRGFSMGGSGHPKHDGIDIPAASGTPVRAGADGRIADAGWRGNYGRLILIRHAGDIETAYAHLSRFVDGLTVGQAVRRGDVIGYVGATGNASGAHLHYEVRRAGKAIDPLESASVLVNAAR